MKKTIGTGFLLVSLVLILGLFAACQGGASTDASGPVTVKILAYADNSAASGADLKTAVEKFMAENPDIIIQYDALYNDAYFQKAQALVAAGDIPDVAYLGADERWARVWLDAGQLVDQRPWMDPEFYDMSLVPAMGPNGEVWEIPLGGPNITSILFCNKLMLGDVFGVEVPRTYEDLVALVGPAKEKGIEVIALHGADGWAWNSCLLSTLVARFSGEADWVQKAVRGEHKFTDQAFVDALAFILRMKNDGVLSDSTITTDDGSAKSKFGNERAIALLQGQWATGTIDAWVSDDTALVPFPAVPGENPAMADSIAAAVQTGYGLTKKGSENPRVKEAALKFIKFYSGPQYAWEKFNNGAITCAILKNFTFDEEEAGVILTNKAVFANQYKKYTDVLDAYLPTQPNDLLNAGVQDMFLGNKTPVQVAEETEKALRDFQN